MTQYKLVFVARTDAPEKILQFQADDAGTALIVAHKEAANRSAVLWNEDRKLCTIRRQDVEGSDLWQVSAA